MPKTTEHQEIKPCPACNDDDNEEGAIYGHAYGESRLECDCGCCGPWCADMDEALTEWNKLAGMRQDTARLDGIFQDSRYRSALRQMFYMKLGDSIREKIDAYLANQNGGNEHGQESRSPLER